MVIREKVLFVLLPRPNQGNIDGQSDEMRVQKIKCQFWSEGDSEGYAGSTLLLDYWNNSVDQPAPPLAAASALQFPKERTSVKR